MSANLFRALRTSDATIRLRDYLANGPGLWVAGVRRWYHVFCALAFSKLTPDFTQKEFFKTTSMRHITQTYQVSQLK